MDVHASMGNLGTRYLRNHSTIGKGRFYVKKELGDVEQNLRVLRLSRPAGLFLFTLRAKEGNSFSSGHGSFLQDSNGVRQSSVKRIGISVIVRIKQN